jgi:hypothetical protein
MRQNEATKIYLREMLLGLGLYMVLLVLALRYGPGIGDGTVRTVVLASPMLGFAVAVWAIVRQLRRMDQYIRTLVLEALAISAAVTAGWTFSYGFLENAGFPKLSMFTVWPVMGATWGAVVCYRKWKDR